MHDLFIIFVILLVLLTLISTMGGSIYAKEDYGASAAYPYESFAYEGLEGEEEGGMDAPDGPDGAEAPEGGYSAEGEEPMDDNAQYDEEVTEGMTESEMVMSAPSPMAMNMPTASPMAMDGSSSMSMGAQNSGGAMFAATPVGTGMQGMQSMPSMQGVSAASTSAPVTLAPGAQGTMMQPEMLPSGGSQTIEGFDGDMYAAF